MEKKGTPKDWDGEPYTPASYLKWKKEALPEYAAEASIEHLAEELKALLRASNAPNRRRFFPLVESFRHWHKTAQAEFGLPIRGESLGTIFGRFLKMQQKSTSAHNNWAALHKIS
jgi:hypothetical protein